MNTSGLPSCLHDEARPGASLIFEKVISSVPSTCQLYVMGGALRNSLLFAFHGVRLPQRDYDCIFIGDDVEGFTRNLLDEGFTLGDLQRETQRTFEYPCIENPQSLNDVVVLDVNFYPAGDIRGLLSDKANFTMNGFAILPQAMLTPKWQEELISLDHSLEDIEAWRLRINPLQNPAFAFSNLFAALRFMSQGFNKPNPEDIAFMRTAIRDFPEEKFEANLRKLFNYVGGEAKARELLRSLGIEENMFDYATATK